MRRALFAFLLIVLSACVPVFEQAEREQLDLTYQGGALTLTSNVDILRGSVGVKAESITSRLCAMKGCLPNGDGIVLLRLMEGPEYGRSVILGDATGLARVKVAIVRADEQRALEKVFEF